MTPNICLKSTLRQPLRTLFLLLLIGLISFAFTSKAVEYLIVQREIERLGSYYRSIGTLKPIYPDEPDISEGVKLIRNSPYLAFENPLRYSSGVMEGLYNADIQGYYSEDSPTGQQLKGLHNGDVWFYGTLDEKREAMKTNGSEESEVVGYTLFFRVDQVIAGYPEHVQEGKSSVLFFPFEGNQDGIPSIEAMQVEQRYLIRGWKENFTVVAPNFQISGATLQIRSLDGDALWYLPVAKDAEVDFNDPDLTDLKNEIDILNENQHTLNIKAAKDMSALPIMQESARYYYLVEGRWLNHQDDLEARKVMVITAGLAQIRGLELGDTITVKLRGLKAPEVIFEYIMTDKDREDWRSYPTYEETFEIVGIIDYVMFRYYGSFTDNVVYIPNSTLPVGFENQDDIRENYNYSFLLDSPRNQEAFVNEYQDRLAKMGISLSFIDNSGKDFWAAVGPLRQSAAANLLIFGGVMTLALSLTAFLYLLQRRRDFAILRALGVSREKAIRQTLLPIALVGGVGILAGGSASWRYSLHKAGETLSNMPTPAGVAPSATLHPLWLVGLMAGITALLVLLAWVGTLSVARRPVLELLQGRSARPNGKRKSTRKASPEISNRDESTVGNAAYQGPALKTPTPALPSARPAAPAGKLEKGHFTVLGRYVLRRIRRAPLKSLLTVVVALGFVLALGWIQWTMERNQATVNRLYETTVVEVDILKSPSGAGKGIPRAPVEAMMQSGFVQDAYLEARAPRKRIRIIQDPPKAKYYDGLYLIWAFNQPESFFSDKLSEASVEYAPGWDESLFTKTWTLETIKETGVPGLFPEKLVKEFDLKLGDELYLVKEVPVHTYIVAGQYSGQVLGSAHYHTILLPFSGLEAIERSALRYDVAQFTLDPAKNRELPAFKDEMEEKFGTAGEGQSPPRIVFWDEELRSVVGPLEKNLSLLEVLYPVTIGASVLIAAGLCLLLVMQTAKDTAVLRVLGTPREEVRIMLTGEQGLLSLIGLGLGLGLLAVLRQDPAAAFSGSGLINAGLYLAGALVGAGLGAFFVTQQKPLELLQVKE